MKGFLRTMMFGRVAGDFEITKFCILTGFDNEILLKIFFGAVATLLAIIGRLNADLVGLIGFCRIFFFLNGIIRFVIVIGRLNGDLIGLVGDNRRVIRDFGMEKRLLIGLLLANLAVPRFEFGLIRLPNALKLGFVFILMEVLVVFEGFENLLFGNPLDGIFDLELAPKSRLGLLERNLGRPLGLPFVFRLNVLLFLPLMFPNLILGEPLLIPLLGGLLRRGRLKDL